MCLYAFLRVLNGPYRFSFVFMDFNGSEWLIMGAYSSLWVIIGSFRSLCIFIGFYGAL